MRVATLLVFVLSATVAMADPNWNVIAENLLTTCLGIAFEDPHIGWIAGDANGAGPEILRSTDGGHTWNSTQANFGIDLLLLAASASKDNVIVSSVFGELYSNDGTTFHQSIGGGLSQSVRHIGQTKAEPSFAVSGTYRGGNGVAVTKNGGKTFTPFTSPVFFTIARYGAFPTETTWYVAAGEFPNTNSSETETETVVRPRKSVHINELGRAELLDTKKDRTATPGNDNGYKAQIVKTTDGGKTWTTQFAENGTIYMNGIDCTSETHCCAVGESDDAPAAGAYIYCTFDGQTWTKQFSAPYVTNEGYSLIDVRFANSTLGWAVGGDLHPLAPKAWFVETKDGGKTWDAQKHELPGYYALGLDVISTDVAFSAVDNLITQASGVAKWLKI